MRNLFSGRAGVSFAAAPLASLLILGTLTGAQADKVGVAAAVKPEATSQSPGGETTTLKIGKSVFYNERIDTSGSGVVQVLLLDGSTFTVGPGSSLVIDKFVYNPKSGTGTLAASFSKGALRFVGGKLSKNEPGVKIKTPAGALTVRGGIALAKVNGPNQAQFVFVFGKYLSLLRNGQLSTLNAASQMFVVSGSGPAKVTDASQAAITPSWPRSRARRRSSSPARPVRANGLITTAFSPPVLIRTSPSSRSSITTAPRRKFCSMA